MKRIDATTWIPLGLAFTILAVVVAMAFGGAWWGSRIETKVGRLEQDMGAVMGHFGIKSESAKQKPNSSQLQAAERE